MLAVQEEPLASDGASPTIDSSETDAHRQMCAVFAGCPDYKNPDHTDKKCFEYDDATRRCSILAPEYHSQVDDETSAMRQCLQTNCPFPSITADVCKLELNPRAGVAGSIIMDNDECNRLLMNNTLCHETYCTAPTT